MHKKNVLIQKLNLTLILTIQKNATNHKYNKYFKKKIILNVNYNYNSKDIFFNIENERMI